MSKRRFLLSRGAWIFAIVWVSVFVLMAVVGQIEDVRLREGLGAILALFGMAWLLGCSLFVLIKH